MLDLDIPKPCSRSGLFRKAAAIRGAVAKNVMTVFEATDGGVVNVGRSNFVHKTHKNFHGHQEILKLSPK